MGRPLIPQHQAPKTPPLNVPEERKGLVHVWTETLEKSFLFGTPEMEICNLRERTVLIIKHKRRFISTVRPTVIYLNCGDRYEDMIDHHSYTHNLSSCEIKA